MRSLRGSSRSLDYLRKHLLSGKPVLIYDFKGREEETDVVFYPASFTPSQVYFLRKAGGQICFVMPLEVGKRLGIDLMTNYLRRLGLERLVKVPRYGDEPAFSIWVNHVNVNTGISDRDKALTIRRLFEVASMALEGNNARDVFFKEFYAPGHVPILLARSLKERRGHTELSPTLMRLLGLKPFAVIAELLSYPESASLDRAIAFAESHGLPILSGEEIIKMAEEGDSSSLGEGEGGQGSNDNTEEVKGNGDKVRVRRGGEGG